MARARRLKEPRIGIGIVIQAPQLPQPQSRVMPNDPSRKDSAYKHDGESAYQRPGKLGEDYDEYGAEMAPNARVWKRYVAETDRMDKELVEGWSKMLDMLLLFATLFSAISTAFVVESSKDLKPDYAASSSQALQAISQTLLVVSTRPSSTIDSLPIPPSPDFTPTRSAVIVNTLWFLSLSLSVAVSLIAILAKDWCYSFTIGRTGSMLRQGRLRQQRWEGIERWKMQEILSLLPSLMHTALLLFAIGLSLYLWDINIAVAIPVVLTTTLAGLFYVVSSFLSFVFRFCPYTTALVRLLRPYLLAMIHYRPLWYHEREASRASPSTFYQPPTRLFDTFRDGIFYLAELLQTLFPMERSQSQLIERETPMDSLTSSMLTWMLINCEDSKSTNIVLQALAGADLRLPRRPLWECGALELVSQRLRASLEMLENRTLGFREVHGLSEDALLDEAALYSRSFQYLADMAVFSGSLDFRGIALTIAELGTPPGQILTHGTSIYFSQRSELSHCRLKSHSATPQRHEIAAFELNTAPFHLLLVGWEEFEHSREQCIRQWTLLKQITTGEVTLLSTAVLALVNGIAKTYVHKPSQSPLLLVDLLNMSASGYQGSPLRYAIGVALTVAAFANHDYPGAIALDQSYSNSEIGRRRDRARKVYEQLALRSRDSESARLQPASLLAFGLLGILTKRDTWKLSMTQIDAITTALANVKHTVSQPLQRLSFEWNTSHYHSDIPTLPATFNDDQHIVKIIGEWYNIGSKGGIGRFALDVSTATLVSVLFDFLPPDRRTHPRMLAQILACVVVTGQSNLQARRLDDIQRSINGFLQEPSAEYFHRLVRTTFLTDLVHIARTCDMNIVPPLMALLWDFSDKIPSLPDEWQVSLLKLLNKDFVITPDDHLPGSVNGLGLADIWISNLLIISRDSPHSVLDSLVLDKMIEFYSRERYKHIKPRNAVELFGTPDKDLTWLHALYQLREECRAALGGTVGSSKQEMSGHETPVEGRNLEEQVIPPKPDQPLRV